MLTLIISGVLLGGILFQESFALTLSFDKLDDLQWKALKEFRANIEHELPHDYMKKYEFLLRFLSMHDFSFSEARSNLQNHLEWRRNNNVDNVLNEDWSDMEQKFPYEITGRTKTGNPILYVPMGKYNFRSEIEAGNLERLKRYIGIKIQEDVARVVRSLRENGEKEVLQCEVIYDLDEYSFYNLACLDCLFFEREMVYQTKAQYPRAADNTFILNTPPFFAQTYPFLSDTLSWSYTHVLGSREAYGPALLEYTEKEKLPKKLREEL